MQSTSCGKAHLPGTELLQASLFCALGRLALGRLRVGRQGRGRGRYFRLIHVCRKVHQVAIGDCGRASALQNSIQVQLGSNFYVVLAVVIILIPACPS